MGKIQVLIFETFWIFFFSEYFLLAVRGTLGSRAPGACPGSVIVLGDGLCPHPPLKSRDCMLGTLVPFPGAGPPAIVAW